MFTVSPKGPCEVYGNQLHAGADALEQFHGGGTN